MYAHGMKDDVVPRGIGLWPSWSQSLITSENTYMIFFKYGALVGVSVHETDP